MTLRSREHRWRIRKRESQPGNEIQQRSCVLTTNPRRGQRIRRSRRSEYLRNSSYFVNPKRERKVTGRSGHADTPDRAVTPRPSGAPIGREFPKSFRRTRIPLLIGSTSPTANRKSPEGDAVVSGHGAWPLTDAVVELAARATGSPDDALAQVGKAVRARLDQPLRVALVGRVSSGKSTLLNALLGRAIAPTSGRECTEVVYVFRRCDPAGLPDVAPKAIWAPTPSAAGRWGASPVTPARPAGPCSCGRTRTWTSCRSAPTRSSASSR
ncbi:dynamin family protein [Amycolatopsis umgeniensis]|uniref:dynamin family protein n=1 Tax=Amycolatopsis umgeniensis TaxID=336628 RepID=UPI00160C52A6